MLLFSFFRQIRHWMDVNIKRLEAECGNHKFPLLVFFFFILRSNYWSFKGQWTSFFSSSHAPWLSLVIVHNYYVHTCMHVLMHLDEGSLLCLKNLLNFELFLCVIQRTWNLSIKLSILVYIKFLTHKWCSILEVIVAFLMIILSRIIRSPPNMLNCSYS